MATLLELGADANFCPGTNVPPPLHLAAMCGSAEMAQLLMGHGADPTKTDFVHFTALHCATYFGNEQVFK